MRLKWADADRTSLRELVRAGYTTREIAKLLRRSYWSCATERTRQGREDAAERERRAREIMEASQNNTR